MTEKITAIHMPIQHTKPWITSGKVPDIKYSYTPSGLVPNFHPIWPRLPKPSPKPETPQNKSVIIRPSECKVEPAAREFREYSFLRENEVLLTIEHCDNCQDHSTSTRHDPEKYATAAKRLKTLVLERFTMIKVLVKPLSKSDSEFKKQRLGAFEVQIAKKSRGLLNVVVLHSKLSSRRWPDLEEVIFKVSQNLPTCQLFVTVFDEITENKNLKGLKVQIKAKHRPADQPHPAGQARPSSSYSRPRPASAVSLKSFKSQRSSSASRLRPPDKFKPNVMQKVTDRDGMCLFEGIPVDIYEIQVLESNDFRGAVKEFNTFEEKGQNFSLNVYIGIRPRDNSVISVCLADPILRVPVSAARVSLVKDSEEFLVPEVKEGTYEISVPKGEYYLLVKSGKFKDLSRKIVAHDSHVCVNENLELSSMRELTVYTVHAMTGDLLDDVQVEVLVNSKKSFMGTTESGKFVMKLEDSGFFYIKAQKSLFFKAKVLVSANKELNLVNVGLVPQTFSLPVLVVSWSKQSDDVEVQGQVGAALLSLKTAKVAGYELVDRMKSHGLSTITCPEQGANLRLSVLGLSQEVTGKNGFANTGVNVQFYSFGSIRASLRPSPGAGEYWDCGVFHAKKQDFLETNFILNYRLKPEDFVEDIQNFIKSLYCVENMKQLGFSHGISKVNNTGKDVVLSCEVFKKTALNGLSEDFCGRLMESLMENDGVSFNLLCLRFKKFVGLGFSPFKRIKDFAEALGVDQEALQRNQRVVEYYFNLKMPADWDLMYGIEGELVYFREDLETRDHPSLHLCKEKLAVEDSFNEQGRVKGSQISEESEKRSKSSASSHSKRSVVRSSPSSSASRLKEVSSSSSKSSLRETNENLKEIKLQFEKFASFVVQSIEYFRKNSIFDRENHEFLKANLQESLNSCKHKLQFDLTKRESDFFQTWSEKFASLHSKMLEIEKVYQSSHN